MVNHHTQLSLVSSSTHRRDTETTTLFSRSDKDSVNEEVEVQTSENDLLTGSKLEQQQTKRTQIEGFTGKANEILVKERNNNDLSIPFIGDNEQIRVFGSDNVNNKEGRKEDLHRDDEIPPAKDPIEYKDWFKMYSPNNDYHKKKSWTSSYKRDRLLLCMLLVATIVSLVVFISFVYQQNHRKSDDNQRMISYLSNKLDIVNRELQNLKYAKKKKVFSPKPKVKHVIQLTEQKQLSGVSGKIDSSVQKKTNEKTIIKLVGDGGVEKSQPGKPIHNWSQILKRGNITFYNGRFIKIKTEGYYILQARMYFKNNFRFNDNNLDFGVVKHSLGERERFVAATTVPKKNCLFACGSYIFEIVHLREGDKLSVRTKTSGQQFGMYGDRASFSLCKI